MNDDVIERLSSGGTELRKAVYDKVAEEYGLTVNERDFLLGWDAALQSLGLLAMAISGQVERLREL